MKLVSYYSMVHSITSTAKLQDVHMVVHLHPPMPYEDLKFKFVTRLLVVTCFKNKLVTMSQGCEKPCKQGCSNLDFILNYWLLVCTTND